MSSWSIVIAVVATALGLCAGMLFTRGHRAALRRVTEVLQTAADGDLAVRVDVRGSGDAVRVAEAVNDVLEKFAEVVRVSAGTTARLSTAGGRLSELVDQMVSGAQSSARSAGDILRASQEVSVNISTLASGSEEMGASIQEISRSASEAVSVAADAMAVSADASRTMTKLGDSSAQISDVVRVITTIAGQTNLLALNATIEAARAGEMGKGFAVVASEVKDLAQETAKATEDITRQVDTIQSDTSGVVRSIAQIGEVIDRVNGYQTTIASAVEEQHATASMMTHSVTEAAGRAGEIAAAMTAIAVTRGRAAATMDETGAVVRDLHDVGTELATTVGRYRL